MADRDLAHVKACTPMPEPGDSASAHDSDEDYDDAICETDKMWPVGAFLRVFFMNPPSKRIPDMVFNVMREWSEYANVNFVRATKPAESDIRIAFKRDKGSFSYIGTDCKTIPVDQETMNLGWVTESLAKDAFRHVVLHETGHALGLHHEHQHPTEKIPWNRDACHKFWGQQGFTNAMVESQIIGRVSARTQFSKFDRRSIMIYTIPRELVKDSRYAVDANSELSATDKAFIAKMYPGRRGKARAKKKRSRSRSRSRSRRGHQSGRSRRSREDEEDSDSSPFSESSWSSSSSSSRYHD